MDEGSYCISCINKNLGALSSTADFLIRLLLFRGVLMKVFILIFSVIFSISAHAVDWKKLKRIYSSANDKALITQAMKDQYGSNLSKLEFKAIYNPIFQIGNQATRLQPILEAAVGDLVREREVVYRIQFFEGNTKKDCYAMITDIRGQPEASLVHVGVCNQSFSEFFNWKSEFTRTVAAQPTTRNTEAKTPEGSK